MENLQVLEQIKSKLSKGFEDEALELIDDNEESLSEIIDTASLLNLIELNNIDEAIEEIDEVLADTQESESETILELTGDFSDEQVDVLNRTDITDLPNGADIVRVVSRKVEEQNRRNEKLANIADDIIDLLEEFRLSGKKAYKVDGSSTAIFQKEVFDRLRENGTLSRDQSDGLGRFSIYLTKSGRSLYIKLGQYLTNSVENHEYFVAELDSEQSNQYIKSVRSSEEFFKAYCKDIDLDETFKAMTAYANFMKVAKLFKDKVDYQLFNDVEFWLK